MKPTFLVKESKTSESSFIVKYIDIPHFYKDFFYHNEYELLYNIENSGTRCIGDNISRYSNHDLVLVGPNIPHFWHSDEKYIKGYPKVKSKSIVIQFVADFLGNPFLNLPEVSSLKNLLKRADRGIQIRGKEARMIGEKIVLLTGLTGWKKLLLLLEILNLMNEAKDYILLASSNFTESNKIRNEDKISNIFNSIVANHNRDYTLNEAAALANMSISAFCRYFKKNTTKTFSTVLNEIRIGSACRSLIYTEESISQIAYKSGYLNVPYFNRQFRKLKGLTPQEYRLENQRKISFLSE
jgi:AraC-like DNA-binding protein